MEFPGPGSDLSGRPVFQEKHQLFTGLLENLRVFFSFCCRLRLLQSGSVKFRRVFSCCVIRIFSQINSETKNLQILYGTEDLISV